MTLYIGTDEAGFGPNLGPLVIGATAWQVADGPADLDLYTRLAGMVSRIPGERTVTLADSKLLYRPGAGLALLERAVLPALHCLGHDVRTWRDLWRMIVPALPPDEWDEPWHRDYDESLPIDAPASSIVEVTSTLRHGLAKEGVRLQAIELDAIFPREFNRLVDQFDSKGAVLSQRTIALARNLWQASTDRLTIVQCDKHGGRNRYVPVLQTAFPEYLVEVVRESRALSVYRWGAPDRRVEFRFAVQGESFLPTACASMLAKYLRELAMRAWNAFWLRQSPGLRPTAGYPVDAQRFRSEIASKAGELALDGRSWWRNR